MTDDTERRTPARPLAHHRAEAAPAPSFVAAFEVPAFRWVWTAALSGNSGRFAVLLVAGWEAYRLGNHSSIWPSLVSFLLLVPMTVFGLPAGGLADRVNRAQQAGLGQALNALTCAAGGALALTGHLGLDGVLAVTALVGLGNSVQAPAWQSLVPALVGPERMVNAGAVTRIAQQGAELTGPAIGTAVLTTLGPGPVFFLCAAFYLAGAAMFGHVRHASPPGIPASGLGWWAHLGEGVSYVGRRRPLSTLLSWVGLHCGLTMASIGILPAVASANLHGDASAYGLLLSFFGAGSIAGPLLLMALRRQDRPALLLALSGVASGAALVGLGLAHSPVAAAAWALLAGAGQSVFMALIYSSTMTVAENRLRGRVSSIQLTLTTGLMGTASLGWGALVFVLAPGLVLALPGVVFVAACAPFIARAGALNHGIAAVSATGGK
ncbi:MAG: MFS transporter [Acidimicrobiales bacterium]